MPMTSINLSSKTRDLIVTRIFDAPIELVWKAWTNPEHIMQWWDRITLHRSAPKSILARDVWHLSACAHQRNSAVRICTAHGLMRKCANGADRIHPKVI